MNIHTFKKTLGGIIATCVLAPMMFNGTVAYGVENTSPTAIVTTSSITGDISPSPLQVNATFLDNHMIRIDVVDLETNEVSSLAIDINDFAPNSDNNPYILIQAVDQKGNLSDTVQIDNPFYVPTLDLGYIEEQVINNENDTPMNLSNPAPSLPSHTPLTPDGTGTVVDNVTNQNGIEFFTVFTEEGNEFFLVVDRQRNSDNVYLLNAVTERDLMALSERSGQPITSDLGVIPPLEEIQPSEPVIIPPVEDNEVVIVETNSSNSNLFIIGAAVVIVGGLGYYFKIVKPRQDGDFDDDDDFGYEGNTLEQDPYGYNPDDHENTNENN